MSPVSAQISRLSLAVAFAVASMVASPLFPVDALASAPVREPVIPCMEEARMATLARIMERLRAGGAPDPKVYQDQEPRLVSRSGNQISYEFHFLGYEDYRGGVWPARERHVTTVVFKRKARTAGEACRMTASVMLDIWY